MDESFHFAIADFHDRCDCCNNWDALKIYTRFELALIGYALCINCYPKKGAALGECDGCKHRMIVPKKELGLKKCIKCEIGILL